ncbi:MAG: carboxypeptidase regulatory-like domain-containing protein [Bryobacteraceae bacterium]
MIRVLITLLVAAMPLPLFAQSTSGSIAGEVRDAQDAAVVNANVTIIDQDKAFTLTTRTSTEGRFVFPTLLPGRYTITVETPGFRKAEQKDINLLANDKITVGTLKLEVGAVTETVEVSAEAVLLKTESSERSEAIIGKQLQNIAVNSRSYLQLAGLAPGIVSTANLQTGGVGGLANISTNGQRFDQNNLTLDGIGNVDTGANGSQMASLSLDSVQEFKILTSNYQAEYGRSSGAQISVVTRSGSSDFHGSAYLYHRHEGLNANNWRNNRDRLPRNLFRFNDPGFTVGGPIYWPGRFNINKDKLFFFVSNEWQEQLRPQGRRDATFPTELERRGDFSQSVDRNGAAYPFIRDPLSGQPCTAANRTGCFADGGVLGRIPQNRLYAPGMAILNFYPLPNALGNVGFNFRSQIPDSYPRRETLLRGDWNINEKWKLYARRLTNKDKLTSAYGSFVLGSGFPLVPVNDFRPGYNYAVSATTLLSANMVNEFTFGIAHNQIDINAVGDGLTRTKTGINVPMLYPEAVQKDYIPRFAYAGSRILGQQQFGTNNAPFFNFNTTIHFIDHLSKVHGKHVFKLGFSFERSRKDQTAFANANGDINFGDSSSNPLDTSFGFANMALGIYTTFNQANGYNTGKYRYTNAEWYVQDQWKATRRLTFDYGMRFYIMQPQYDQALLTATFLPERFNTAQAVRLYRSTGTPAAPSAVDPATGQTVPFTLLGRIVPGSGNITNGVAQAGKDVSRYLMENRGIHYSPRFGLAWDITGTQRFVFRTGAAIMYDRFQGNEVFDMITNPPATFAPTLVNGYLRDVDARTALLAPFPLHAFDYNGDVPTTYSYSAGVQTRLPYQFTLDIAYVGSQSRHQLERLNLNAIPYGATFQPQNQDPTKNPASTLGSAALDANFLRRFPGYADISLHQMGGTANYNSMQTAINRRFARNLFLGMNWTWSRALGTTSDRGNFHRIDEHTRYANYGPLTFDRHHTVNIFYTYEIPRAIKSNGLLHRLVDGWQISGFTLFQSGSPFDVGFSIPGIGNQNLTGSYTEGTRLLLVGNPLEGASDSPYNRLNPNAFGLPYVGSRGLETPVRYLRGPGINNHSLSVQKSFDLGGDGNRKLELRADAFNAFNHTQFSGVNSTVNFTSLTNRAITNLYLRADGTVNNINGFGTVSGARDPRIMQLVARFQF